MIRPFQIEDSKTICDMLMAEGLTQDEMDFLDNETWVYDDGEVKGFYTYKIEHGIFPHLQHFCVREDSRGGSVTRSLIAHFKNRVKKYKKAIVNAPIKNDFINRIIMRYFGVTKPYANDSEHNFYFVEI